MDENETEFAPDSEASDPADRLPNPLDGLISSKRERERETFHWYTGAKASANASEPEDLSCDPRWIELLADTLAEASTLRVNVRRGRGEYLPLFDRVVAVVTSAEARAEATRIGAEIYAECSRYCLRHGPVLDFQLVALGPKSKKGQREIDSSTIRINLANDPRGGDDLDDLDDPAALRNLLANATSQQREVRWILSDFRKERAQIVSMLIDTLRALPDTLAKAAEVQTIGMELVNKGIRYNKDLLDQTVDRERRRLEAEFSVEKLRMVSESINRGIDIVSGETGSLLQQLLLARFGPQSVAKTPEDLPEAARMFREQMNMRQAAAIGDEAFGEIAGILDRAASCASDEGALPILIACWEILESHKDALWPTLTPQQTVIVQWIQGRRAAWESAGGA